MTGVALLLLDNALCIYISVAVLFVFTEDRAAVLCYHVTSLIVAFPDTDCELQAIFISVCNYIN